MASSATSRGGTRLPHHTARRAGLDPPTRLTRANHLAKIVPLSMEGKELRRRLCHHHCRADRFSSLPPPPSAHYHRYRQRHRHCTAASSYTDQPSSRGTRIPELTDLDRVIRTFDERFTYNPLLDLPSLIYPYW